MTLHSDPYRSTTTDWAADLEPRRDWLMELVAWIGPVVALLVYAVGMIVLVVAVGAWVKP